jgi:SWI/SNF-related matrix-associated actin-dependent regulator 1 of chromatin subfamily A
VMGLSGTPLANNPIELFPIVHMLWPTAFPSFTKYAVDFCAPKEKPWGIEYGACNLDILHNRLLSLGMIRRRKEDVLKDLPPKMRRIIPCELSDPAQYKHATQDFMGWLKRNKASRVRSAMRAEALVKVGYLLELTARLKFRPIIQWANDYLQQTDEKLVMLAVHRGAVELMQRRITAKSVVVTGSTQNKERHELVQKFQHDPSTRVIIGTRALWTGVTLTAASCMGMTEFWWVPGEMAQAEARIDRIGQKNVSWINYFPAIGTIEERVCELIDEKQGYLSAVLDGGPMPTDLNICAMILDQLDKEI